MVAINKTHVNSQAVQFVTGEVIAKGDATLLVKCGQQSLVAKTALSFLFVPEIHDQVLIMQSNDHAFIMQILARPTELPLALRIDNALMIEAEHAQLHIQAEALHLHSASLVMQHEQVDLAWQHTCLQGESLSASVADVNVESTFCHYVLDTLSVKAKNVLHWIEDLKQQMLGRLHVSVQKHYQLDCESVDIYSQKDVKIDAKQIHLG